MSGPSCCLHQSPTAASAHVFYRKVEGHNGVEQTKKVIDTDTWAVKGDGSDADSDAGNGRSGDETSMAEDGDQKSMAEDGEDSPAVDVEHAVDDVKSVDGDAEHMSDAEPMAAKAESERTSACENVQKRTMNSDKSGLHKFFRRV